MGYTDTNSVRKLLPTLLTDDDYIGTIIGTAITLSQHAMEVPFIFKNGTRLISGTDYTFQRPVAITLSIAGTGETFIAQCDYAISDTDIEELIDRADRVIASTFVYGAMPPTMIRSDWSAQLAAAMYLKQYSMATKVEIARATEMYQSVIDAMAAYKMTSQAAVCDYSEVSDTGGMSRIDSDTSDPSMRLDQREVPVYD